MVCFKDFGDNVCAYIFSRIIDEYNSYGLTYKKDMLKVVIHTYELSRFCSLVQYELGDYLSKFKDELSRRGVYRNDNKYDSCAEKMEEWFEIEEELFLPSLLDNIRVDDKQVAKFALERLANIDSRVKDLENRINNI